MTVQREDTAAVVALAAIARGERVDEAAKATLRSYGDAAPEVGLDLQTGVLATWLDAGETIGGWKIGMTSRKARDSMGAGFRPFGYVLDSRIRRSGDVLGPGEAGPNAGVEMEICLTLGERLSGPSVTAEQARAAVRSVSPAFEIVCRRLPSRVGAPVRIGNALGNWGIVVGPEHATDVALDALEVRMLRDGEVVQAGGTGADVLDDPYTSLARVCRHLDVHGLALEPGQHVITGSLFAPDPVEGPATFTGDFGALGAVTIAFS